MRCFGALRVLNMIIGITGPTGAGKTTALRCLEKMGFAIYDCDAIYHRLLNESNELNIAIASAFPAALTNGYVDRKKLGAIVFSDDAQLLKLNLISHKAVKEEVMRLIASLPTGSDVAIDAVELISGGLGRLCDITVAVLAPKEMRIDRIMHRDNIDRERAIMRVEAQKPDEYYITNCSSVLFNDCRSENEFSNKCADFFGRLKEENTNE